MEAGSPRSGASMVRWGSSSGQQTLSCIMAKGARELCGASFIRRLGFISTHKFRQNTNIQTIAGQIVNILGFVNYNISSATPQPLHYSMKTTTDNKGVWLGLNKTSFTNKKKNWIWLTSYTLPTSSLAYLPQSTASWQQYGHTNDLAQWINVTDTESRGIFGFVSWPP